MSLSALQSDMSGPVELDLEVSDDIAKLCVARIDLQIIAVISRTKILWFVGTCVVRRSKAQRRHQLHNNEQR